MDQVAQDEITYNKKFGAVENENKSYFMFASDLPSMVDAFSPLKKACSSSKNKLDDK